MRLAQGFLAGAGLADDQDRQPVARGLGGDRERGRNSGAAPTNCSSDSAGASFSDTGASSPGGAAAVGIGGERFEQPFGRDWPDEEIGGAGAHRLDRVGHRVAVAEDDHREVVACSRRAAMSLGPVSLSQAPSSAAWTSRPCGPWSKADGGSPSAAPTALQPARAAIAEIRRRSSASAVQQQQGPGAALRASAAPLTGEPNARRSKGVLKAGAWARAAGLLWAGRAQCP